MLYSKSRIQYVASSKFTSLIFVFIIYDNALRESIAGAYIVLNVML